MVCWHGLKPHRASWSWERLPLSSIWSGHHWWSHCCLGQRDQGHKWASASTEALLCLCSNHKSETLNDIWNTGVLTYKLILCLFEATFKHLSQCQVVRLWVAVLDIFVRIPGDAPPQQRDLKSSTRFGVTIDQSEGVWENRCELRGQWEEGGGWTWWLMMCFMSGAYHWRYCWPQHHKGQ